MITTTQLQNTATQLQHLYTTLQQLKTTRPPTTPTTNHHNHGPRTPGNWLYIAEYLNLAPQLQTIAFQTFRTIGIKITDDNTTPPQLCKLIHQHAPSILTHPAIAQQLHTEMLQQIAILTHRCHQQPPTTTTTEPWLTPKEISHKTHTKITPELLRKWVQRGKITEIKKHQGHNLYKLSEILTHIDNQQKQ